MSTLKTNNIQHVDRSDPSILINTDGSVSIAGTMTYEDVTNVDAVGIITGRDNIDAQKRVLVGTGVSIAAGGLNVTAGISTFAGDVSIADKIIHTGDTNTAIRFPSADTVSVETGGSQRLRVDSSGRLILGGTSAGTYHGDGDDLNIFSSANTGLTVFSGTSSLGSLFFADGNNNVSEQRRGAIQYNHNGNHLAFWTDASERLRITSGGDMGLGTNSPASSHDRVLTIAGTNSAELKLTGSNYGVTDTDGADVLFSYGGLYLINNESSGNIHFFTGSGPTERLRINSSGKILIGDDTAENTMGLNANVQTFGTDASSSSIAIRRGSNDAQAAFLVMSKSRNTSVGSRTILNNGDEVGNIFFVADDGTDLASNTAAIKSRIDAAPGANDTPGNLSFWTTADGANSATERLRIDSGGRIFIGTTPQGRLCRMHISGDNFPNAAAGGSQVPLIVSNQDEDYGLQIGAFSSGKGFLQATRNDGTATVYNIELNPSGGNVEIPDGDLIFGTNGHGIDFSAASGSAGGSSSAILDDYEEGTFTPTNSVGLTLTNNNPAYYIKVGNLVHIQLDISFSGASDTAQCGRIQSLPFTSENVTNHFAQGSIQHISQPGSNSFEHNQAGLLMYIAPGESRIDIVTITNGAIAPRSTLVTRRFRISMMYKAG